jgi:rhamnulokinase
MSNTANFIAVDLGASGGRILLGRWDGEKFSLAELHRFANSAVNVLGHFHWDALRLWSEIKTGLARYAADYNDPPAGIGVDTWGVDYALLDQAGNLLGNPRAYRDPRTDGALDLVFQRIPREELFKQTGIQFLQINTLFQLFSAAYHGDPHLDAAHTFLMMPDLFHYWLTGRKAVEYTNASTTHMLHAQERRWATGLLARLGIPTQILPEIIPPGTVLGQLRPEIMAEVGLKQPVPVIAPGTHDTASAVAAVPGLDEKSLYLSSGTWSLMGVEAPQPVINEQVLAYNFTNEGGVGGTIRLLKNVAGLWLLQECSRIWEQSGQRHTWDDLLAQAKTAEPFRSLVDPDAGDFLNPGDMPAAIRAYCRRAGQPEPETVGQVVRCCLESLALRYRWVLEALEKLVGHRLEVIRIVGGGSQNRLLSQFTADACHRPVITGPVEATALGNLMLQAIATAHLASLAEGRQAIAASFGQEQIDPNPESAWDEAFSRFNNLP